MAQFEQLQELWQRQPQQQQPAVDPGRVAAGVRSYGRRLAWLIALKLVVVLSVLAVASFHNDGLLFRVGAAWMAVGAVLMVVLDFRAQRRIAHLDFSSPSLPFVLSALASLDSQRQPFLRRYWMFLAALLAGANLMFFGAVAEDGRPRWLGHALISALCSVAFAVGLRVRRRRFERECRPLLNQLAASRASLERLFREYNPDR